MPAVRNVNKNSFITSNAKKCVKYVQEKRSDKKETLWQILFHFFSQAFSFERDHQNPNQENAPKIFEFAI